MASLRIGTNGEVNIGKCGKVSWKINWKVSPISDENNGGQILQDISIVLKIRKCENSKHENYTKKYSETWRVYAATDIIQFGGQDEFALEEITCSQGSFEISGVARYYPNKGEVDWPIEPQGPAGNLPITDNNPGWDKTGAPTFKEQVQHQSEERELRLGI